MRYELVGLIEHQGDGLGSGHYIAICRRGDKWYEVDQDLVVEIDLPAVLNKQVSGWMTSWERTQTHILRM